MQIKLSYVEEARQKRLHVVLFHLYDISSEGKTMETKGISGCLRLGAGELTSHRHKGTFRGDGKCPKIRLW